MNSQAERFKDKCPGCGNWGKGHVIDVVSPKPLCTIKLVEEARLAEIIHTMMETDEARVAPWRLCAGNYCERPKETLLSRLFGRKHISKHYCPVCGKRIKNMGAFCNIECAIKYMEEKKDDDDESLPEG